MRYFTMSIRKNLEPERPRSSRLRKCIVSCSFCICLLLLGPHFPALTEVVFSPGPAHGAEGDVQSSTDPSTGTNDTPSEEDIADFAAEFDKDGDGEIDEPQEDDEDIGAEDETDAEDQADAEDEADQDDRDAQDDSDDQDQDNREDEYLDDEKILEDDTEDVAHTGKNRDDIDAAASPDYRLSGYDRYLAEGRLRRLGGLDELTPLIEREEKMILEQ